MTELNMESKRKWRSRMAERIERENERKLLPAAVAVIVCVGLAIVFLILVGCKVAMANDDIVKERIVNAVIGEAEGEPYKGKLGVACAIINRVQTHGSFDKAMRGVYGEKSPRVINRKYSSKTFVDAVRAYEESLNVGTCDFIDGADHWEGTSFQTPAWAKSMVVTATIGNQRFFRARAK